MRLMQIAMPLTSIALLVATTSGCLPDGGDGSDDAAVVGDAAAAEVRDDVRIDGGATLVLPDAALTDEGLPQEHNGCWQHRQCPLGMACIDGDCSAANCIVLGCAGGSACDPSSGTCVVIAGGECESIGGCDSPVEPIRCELDDQCASGSWCVGGRCFVAHCELAGCPGSATCDVASGLCIGAAACNRNDAGVATCSYDVECIGDQFCIGGTCRPVACATGVCPSGATCDVDSGRCRQGMVECICGMCGTPQESGG